ncbi:type 1 glutamine amidotransferase [Cryobacterium sp. PH29-G1]|uniref:type 1 glutamine amidotransferase n=1 Tax=Cryobacterium sp. PH29-G1 TaxID=3046211 RepID=UPI0024BA4274|nr:type 1 glutamine amidotransferase [Cryobacterium sp. PH29-G1]MDJ0349582.1 type 1 glutamine amidotransferase [Cryobacterium sp. PH29-G1]
MTSRTVSPFAGEALPEVTSVAAVICLGGPQSAYDTEKYPFLLREENFLRDAVQAQVPVLGICLGSQILARALGGEAIPGPSGLEYGLIDVLPAPGQHVTDLTGLEGRFFSFHSDTFRPPVDAELLAVSDRYPQAWRLGSALAVQFHPEISPVGIHHLLAIEGPKLRASGVDTAELLAATVDDGGRAWRGAQRVVGGWLAAAVSESATEPFR